MVRVELGLLNKNIRFVVRFLILGGILYMDRFKLPLERVWISVFEEDDEALAIWRDEVWCAILWPSNEICSHEIKK